jgi:hypothetical protein
MSFKCLSVAAAFALRLGLLFQTFWRVRGSCVLGMLASANESDFEECDSEESIQEEGATASSGQAGALRRVIVVQGVRLLNGLVCEAISGGGSGFQIRANQLDHQVFQNVNHFHQFHSNHHHH